MLNKRVKHEVLDKQCCSYTIQPSIVYNNTQFAEEHQTLPTISLELVVIASHFVYMCNISAKVTKQTSL